MKRFSILMLSALAALMASCSNEEPISDPVIPGDPAALSFTITKPSSPYVTRADIATEYEWNIASFDVYVAVDGGTVAKLTKGTDYRLTPDALDSANRTYTITMSAGWLATNNGKTANFYFVGNDATSTAGPHTSLSATNPTETVFKSALANTLTVISGGAQNGRINLIHKPNGGTQNLLFSSVVEGVEVVGKVEETGKLQRREARFDIQNASNAPGAGQFVVTKIIVTNAANTGLIFPTGNAATPIDRTGIHAEITGPATAAYTLDAPGSAAGAKDLAPAVFYLYPTQMGPATTATQVIVMGTLDGGSEKAYPVKVAQATDITANYRYIISVDPVKGAFIDSVEDMSDWGLVGSTEPGVNTVAATMTTDTSALGTGSYDPTSGFFTAVDNTASTLSLNLSSEYGVNVSVAYREGGSGARVVGLTESATVSTRAFGVTQIVDVTIPTGDFAIDADLVIDDGVAPQKITVRKFWGGNADYLLYLDGNKLAVGKMGDPNLSINSMLLFNFGSIVGMATTGAWDSTNGTTVKFNPSSYDGKAYANIPKYTAADYNANRRNVSAPEYMTLANVQAGKGDPCIFVGMTAADIAALDQAGLDALVTGSIYRLPTVFENLSFIGGPTTAPGGTQTSTYLPFFWKEWQLGSSPSFNFRILTSWSGNNATASPANQAYSNTYTVGSPHSYGKFPVEAQGATAARSHTLVATGYRDSTGGVLTTGASGLYWSSNPSDAISGHYMNFNATAIWPTNRLLYASGFAARCVPR